MCSYKLLLYPSHEPCPIYLVPFSRFISLSFYSVSGGQVVGDLAPHEAFPIGGANSVRGYDEGAVGSGRAYVVTSGEISAPLVSNLDTI